MKSGKNRGKRKKPCAARPWENRHAVGKIRAVDMIITIGDRKGCKILAVEKHLIKYLYTGQGKCDDEIVLNCFPSCGRTALV